jgi:hypothetical protein
MNMKFTVYPKKGDKFTIETSRFELKDDKFILYDDAYEESKEGFLSFDKVAAIIPEQHQTKDTLCFHVYLKDRPYFEVFASAFDAEQEPSVTFLYQEKDMMDKIVRERPIKYIYIAPSIFAVQAV